MLARSTRYVSIWELSKHLATQTSERGSRWFGV